MSQPAESVRVARGNGWRCSVRAPFLEDFSAARFANMGDFLAAQGKVIKQDHRSGVILLEGPGGGRPADPSRAFVLKVYRYRSGRAVRTLLRRSRGENEFLNLLHLRALGVPAVEPVAWGVERNLWGMVRSSFVITRFVEGCEDLRSWQRSPGLAREAGAEKIQAERRDRILRKVGALFRGIHVSGFFLFTPKPSNILIRRAGVDAPDLLFLDLPRARHMRWPVLRVLAQSRDLGTFLADFPSQGTPTDWGPFFEDYLPDPLGGTPEALRRRVARAVLAQRNQTPFTGLVHRIKRRIRHASRTAPDGASTGEREQPSRPE